MVATDSPFLHLVKSKRLFSKFHGPFISTHSIWHLKLNLNCRMFCPTSTIRRLEPIFQTDRSVLFRAHRLWCHLASSRPNKLNVHSSRSSDLLMVEMVMSSSSSLVSLRCWMPSRIAWSMTVRRVCKLSGYQDLGGSLKGREHSCCSEREGILRGRVLCCCLTLTITMT